MVEFVRVSQLYLPLLTYVEWKTRLGKSWLQVFEPSGTQHKPRLLTAEYYACY